MTYRRASASAMNQQPTNNPMAASTVPMVSQSLRPHQTTKLAILDATMLGPQNVSSAPISDAPISELPRYPAGRVTAPLLPLMCVTPPSRVEAHRLDYAAGELVGKDVAKCMLKGPDA